MSAAGTITIEAWLGLLLAIAAVGKILEIRGAIVRARFAAAEGPLDAPKQRHAFPLAVGVAEGVVGVALVAGIVSVRATASASAGGSPAFSGR